MIFQGHIIVHSTRLNKKDDAGKMNVVPLLSQNVLQIIFRKKTIIF